VKLTMGTSNFYWIHSRGFLTINRNIDGYAMAHQADLSIFFVVRVTIFSCVYMNNI
jgi:hypothetical protein